MCSGCRVPLQENTGESQWYKLETSPGESCGHVKLMFTWAPKVQGPQVCNILCGEPSTLLYSLLVFLSLFSHHIVSKSSDIDFAHFSSSKLKLLLILTLETKSSLLSGLWISFQHSWTCSFQWVCTCKNSDHLTFIVINDEEWFDVSRLDPRGMELTPVPLTIVEWCFRIMYLDNMGPMSTMVDQCQLLGQIEMVAISSHLKDMLLILVINNQLHISNARVILWSNKCILILLSKAPMVCSQSIEQDHK